MSPEYDLAVARIPKCGSQSIAAWLGPQFKSVSNDAARAVSRRVAFIRHPIDRIESAYSFLTLLGTYGQKHKTGAPGEWEPFVDWILENDNEHWRPQSELVGNVPNIYHRVSDLSRVFSRYRPGILRCDNQSTRLPTTDYRRADLERRYRDDFILWESLDGMDRH